MKWKIPREMGCGKVSNNLVHNKKRTRRGIVYIVTDGSRAVRNRREMEMRMQRSRFV